MPPSRSEEVARKLESVARFLHEHSLDAIVLQRRGPVGWLLAGADTSVRLDAEDGAAVVCVLRDGTATLLTDVVEAPRFLAEELAGLPVEVMALPWLEARADAACAWLERRGATRVAAESPLGVLPSLSAEQAEAFRALRYELGADELERYRRLCRASALELEAAAAGLRPGVTEREAAADLSRRIVRLGYRPVVVLVAFDERIVRFRHPLPTAHELLHRAMLVLCAEHGGQVMAATRFAGFEEPSGELARRFAAVVRVDAAANAATRPGVPVARVFETIVAEYRAQGYPDEWRSLHQGGSIGYATREYLGTPAARQIVRQNQAFAWNPSITGTKCEDTVLVGPERNELLTATGAWPTVATAAGPRPVAKLLAR